MSADSHDSTTTVIFSDARVRRSQRGDSGSMWHRSREATSVRDSSMARTRSCWRKRRSDRPNAQRSRVPTRTLQVASSTSEISPARSSEAGGSGSAPPWPLAFAGAAAGALGSIAAVLALAV